MILVHGGFNDFSCQRNSQNTAACLLFKLLGFYTPPTPHRSTTFISSNRPYYWTFIYRFLERWETLYFQISFCRAAFLRRMRDISNSTVRSQCSVKQSRGVISPTVGESEIYPSPPPQTTHATVPLHSSRFWQSVCLWNSRQIRKFIRFSQTLR